MDYEVGLRALKALLPEKAQGEYLVLETRLTENLRSERLYGPTEAVRAERARIVDTLNRLALKRLSTSFNDLCREEPLRGKPHIDVPPPTMSKEPARRGETRETTALAPDPRALRKILNDQFSANELADLCMDLELDYENIAGDTKEAKARELVLYLQRRGQLDRLVAAIRAVRG
jgi:hypothetical protein